LSAIDKSGFNVEEYYHELERNSENRCTYAYHS